MEEKNGRGRPKKDNAKNNTVVFRFSDEEIGMLDYIANKRDMSKTEVIRKALKAQYNFETCVDDLYIQ